MGNAGAVVALQAQKWQLKMNDPPRLALESIIMNHAQVSKILETESTADRTRETYNVGENSLNDKDSVECITKSRTSYLACGIFVTVQYKSRFTR